MKNKGKVFSISQIYEEIWNEEAIGADNTVAVHIRHIREKIEINPKEPRYLKVVWGVGYKVEKISGVDLFPGTYHVETVCLLSKLQSKEHIEIEVKMDEMDLTSAESKATYEEIREYVLEHTGLKVSHLYIAQVKQKYGIIERENYNKPKSENAKQPQCPAEKEKAITEALRHFGMIL